MTGHDPIAFSRRAVLGGAAAAVALATSGCGRARTVEPGTLELALASGPDTLHPYLDSTREGNFIKRNVFDALLQADSRDLAVGPGLAVSWRELDELTLDLTLRPDATFHDGAPVTAEDAAWTIGYILAKGTEEGFSNPSSFRWIERAEVLGPRDLRIVSRFPNPIRLTQIAWMPILSRAAYERLGRDGMANAPIGSGPYRIESQTPGQSIRLARHTGYRGPKAGATIAHVEMRIIPSAETRIAELLAGSLHWDFSLTQDQVEPLRHEPALKVEDATTFRVAALQMDAAGRAGQPALTVRAVRQAIAHAIDRASIVQYLWGLPPEAVLNAFCAPGTFGCDQAAVPAYPYDPDRARQLLKEAGYGDGFEVTIGTSLNRPEVAVIASNLRDVGIEAAVNIYPAATFARLRDRGQLQMAYVGFGGSQLGDIVAGIYNYHYMFGARDMARDEAVKARVEAMMRLMDPERRLAEIRALETYLATEMYNLPINVWTRPYVSARTLDWPPTPDELPALWTARFI